MKAVAAIAVLVLFGPRGSSAQEAPPSPFTPEQIDFFEKHVRPVLADRCYKCHSTGAEKLKAALFVDSREGLLKGGETGPALVPGKPDESRLIRAVRYLDENLQMPPKVKLPEDQIAALEAWVKMGAPMPAGGTGPKATLPAVDFAQARKHWSFQPPRAQAPPAVRESARVVTPIDAFILAKLEEKGLPPAPPADKRTLLRRATVDLTGLPPTPGELDAFLADDSPEAFERVVDRLLASPRYGERWGRHWLDVARYADTKEWVVDEERRLPFSYTYRDWVIQAVNADLPYDRFLLQQIAADKLETARDKSTLAGLGFLTVGRTFLNRQPDQIDDKIDVVCRGLMGLTAQCARCHDHKFDPIPTRDYYSLYGVFASSTTPKELPLLGAPEKTPEYAAYEKELHGKEGEITSFKMARHATLVAGFRTPEKIAEYLFASRDGKAPEEPPVKKRPDPNLPNPVILRRWMATLKKAAETRDAVFAPWLAYAALPEKDFAERAIDVLPSLPDVNPIVRESFAEAPTTLKEAAQRYGSLLASFNTDGAMPDPAMEAIRLAVCAPDAAPNMPLDDVDQFLSQDDKGKLRKMRKDLEGSQFHPGAPPRAMALVDTPSPASPKVFVRGNPGTPGEEVPRQFLGILSPDSRIAWKTGGRLELAEAIASRENPLTARVWVNRVWLHHFGAGIVRTPSDFGTRGERPTNPELLDWLAVWFMDHGWSTKQLHKLILLSSTWRQSCEGAAETVKADPLNLLFGRANRLRLEFEALRDSFLMVAGRLDLTMGGRAVMLTQEPYSGRRTVYGYIDRLNLANMYRVFDFAVPDMHAPQRYTTTVPQQALFLMNSPFVMEQAQVLVRRPEIAGEADPEQRIQRLYRAVFGRAATAHETTLGLRFLARPTTEPVTSAPVWQYGFGSVDEKTGRTAAFTPLPFYTGSAWQGGPKLPDPKTGWCLLTATGGHAGEGADRILLRRWTAPRDGVITVAGTLSHQAPAGDGVRGRILASGQGELASWVVCRMTAETRITGIPVKRGETLDFAIDCRADTNSDTFTWAPVISMKDPGEEWNAISGFSGPPETLPEPLRPWEKYAQILLESNEFSFVE
jgi:hypothetical protein